jgi:hypothetical protein
MSGLQVSPVGQSVSGSRLRCLVKEEGRYRTEFNLRRARAVWLFVGGSVRIKILKICVSLNQSGHKALSIGEDKAGKKSEDRGHKR